MYLFTLYQYPSILPYLKGDNTTSNSESMKIEKRFSTSIAHVNVLSCNEHSTQNDENHHRQGILRHR